jgi:hypothetical protein
VTQQEYVLSLQARHQELEEAIEQERGRPLPDTLLVQMLKRQKLRIKDKLYRIAHT